MLENIFDIVSQYNLGAALISGDEKVKLAELNLLAGRKSISNTAYGAALQFFSFGLSLIEGHDWQTNHDLLFKLSYKKATCLCLLNASEEGESQFTQLLSFARTGLEEASIYRMLAEISANKWQHQAAVEWSLKGLHLLGVELPLRPSSEQVLEEYEAVWKNIGDRRIADLVDLPLMTDQHISMAVSMLQTLYVIALALDHNLYLLTTFRMVNISLKYGNCDASVLAYSQFGAAVTAFLQQVRRG